MIAAANKTTLANGVRILTAHMPYVHSVSMGVWVTMGARDESARESGLSHFLEHMLFKGTRKRSAHQIAKAFDAIGGHSNAFTSHENTCYYAKVIDSHLDRMVDILADIVLNSIFDPQEVENERPVILQEIGMVDDLPEDYLHQTAVSRFWPNHPLGRPILGPRENVAAFDAAAIEHFFRRVYQAQRVVIAAAGNLEHHRFVDQVAPFFEQIPGNGKPQPLRRPPQPAFGVDLISRPQEQTHLCLITPGVSSADPRRYSFSLLNTIFGGNMSSRLAHEVREKRGLAYSIYSFASPYHDTGLFGVYAGVDSENACKTVDLILQAMDDLKKTPIDEEELQQAKEFTKGNLLLASENNDNQMVRLAHNEMLFGRHIGTNEVLAAIDAVSAAQLSSLAASLMDRSRMRLTVLGPVADDAALQDCLKTPGNGKN